MDVRVERVQEITEDDAVAERVTGDECIKYGPGYDQPSPRMCFESLWNYINEKRGYGWDVNPWVWVVEFKKVTE